MPQENNKSLLTMLLLMTAVYCSFTLLPPIFACKHAETTVQTVQAATCVEDGLDQKICQNCNSMVEEIIVPAAGHQFGEYALTTNPTPTSNGEETRECSVCNFLDKRVYICPHAENELRLILEPECDEVGINEATCKLCSLVHYLPIDKIPHAETKSVIMQEPTCSEEGIEHLICVRCEAVAEELPIALLECNWGDWILDEYATPFESGIRHHECQDCGRSVSEEYSITMEKNYLYIPSANIFCKFAITSFTQGAVDSNDVIYTKRAYGVVDDTNPFVLGHWFGSLTTMWHTPVGAYVYINIDGRIDTYQVINSEYAVEMYECYHIGQETGVNVFDAYGSAMNSQYAVYGRNHQGEDLNPEKNDGRTLHMYTCHNKKDRPGWDPKHGGRGRWIILANLIHSVDIETGEVLFEEEPADLTSLQPVEIPENTEKQPS